MNRQSRLHCVINLLSRHLYPTSFFFSSKTWFCLPSLGSINELMLWVRDPRPAECLPHVGHFCSDKDGGQSSIAVEQARNKLTAIMDSVIQLDTLGLLSLFFFFFEWFWESLHGRLQCLDDSRIYKNIVFSYQNWQLCLVGPCPWSCCCRLVISINHIKD